MNYTDLIFDLYGTLVDIHTDENNEVWSKTALYFGYYGAHFTAEELRSAFQASMKAREAQSGQSYECFPDIPFESVLQELLDEKGVSENSAALAQNAAQFFRIASTEYIRLYPNVIDSLAALRKAGYRLWLLSNAQRIFTEYELRHLGLLNQFHGLYLSSDYGCRKPDARFYRALIDEQKLSIDRCLMIGNDRETDIAGAKALGIATLYMHTNLTPSEQCEADPHLLPGIAPAGCRNFEYEGADWITLVSLIQTL